LITGSIEKANTFNEYFASEFTINNNKIPVCTQQVEDTCMRLNVEFSSEKLFQSKYNFGPESLPSLLPHNLVKIIKQ
jgi:hypothetical protein